MRSVFGIGETILDIIFKEEQPYKAVPGGSVFNGLVSLGRLQVPVTFISEVGKDQVGDLILRFMAQNHISTQYIDRFPDGKSPISLAFLDANRNAKYAFYKDYPTQRLEVPFPRIEADDIFIIGSYYALNPALRPRMVEFLQYAHERRAIIYYDLNFRKAHAHEAIRLMPTVLENLEYADIVRGSDEDCLNLFQKSDANRVYQDHIRYYCDRFILTEGAQGVHLFQQGKETHFEADPISVVSTIGAGDNFNAGILFGLLQLDVRRNDLPHLTEEKWAKIIRCGMDLASEVCQQYDNYISTEFAQHYRAPL